MIELEQNVGYAQLIIVFKYKINMEVDIEFLESYIKDKLIDYPGYNTKYIFGKFYDTEDGSTFDAIRFCTNSVYGKLLHYIKISEYEELINLKNKI